MDEFDGYSFTITQKILSLCFIPGIVAVNGILIWQITRKGGFMCHLKWRTLISLAIGDIFLALFPLVVRLRHVFEGYYDLPCITNLTSTIYWNQIMPFVYGAGLSLLAVELIIRQRAAHSPSNTYKNIMKATAFSAIPWFLGLIIVLPLTMTNMDWDHCHIKSDNSKLRGLTIVCISECLPAAAAFITCLVMCIRFPHTSTQGIISAPTATTYEPPLLANSTNANDSSKAIQQPSMAVTIGANQYHDPQPGPGYNQYQNPQQDPRSDQYQNSPQAPSYDPQYEANLYPRQQCPSQPYCHPSGSNTTAPIYISQPHMTPTPISTGISKEKYSLMLAAIIYCFCVLPSALYGLVSILDPKAEFELSIAASRALFSTFQWLLILRAVITPIIWIKFPHSDMENEPPKNRLIFT